MNFKGPQVDILKLCSCSASSLEKIFVLSMLSDPDEMPYSEVFYLGLHCLEAPVYGFQSTMDF